VLLVLSKGFGFRLPLSKQFQKTNINFKMDLNLVQDTFEENVLKQISILNFTTFFLKLIKISEKIESPLTLFQRFR